MRFVSLFAGIGGFDLAFKRAGMTCDTVCEIDKSCQEILKRHFPEAKLIDDVKKIGANTHERGTVDLVCGGFPCQDLSIAGKRSGLAGKRSGLWFEFARVIDELDPRWVVIENVPGLLSSDKGKDFAILIRWLAERGYGVSWRVLDAQYFGVAQRRKRVFIVGSLGNGRSAQVLFERESCEWDPAQIRKEGEKAAGTIGARTITNGNQPEGVTLAVGHSGGETLKLNELANTINGQTGSESTAMFQGVLQKRNKSPIEQDKRIVGSLSSDDLDQGSTTLQAARSGMLITAYNIQNNDGGEHKRKDRPEGGMYVNETEVSLALGSSDKTLCMSSGQANAEIVENGSPSLTGLHEQPIVWHNKQSAGEVRVQDDISPTMSQNWGTGGNNVPFIGVRRLTPTECERLQGFPDSWTDGQADSTRYRQLGNAVAVPVVEWIGKKIMEVEKEK